MAYYIHRLVRQETQNYDPYLRVKETSTRQALALYPRLKTRLAEAADPLEMAVRLSIAGKHHRPGHVARIRPGTARLSESLTQPFAIGDLPAFRQALAGASRVLYLADNAGETVFDRLLVETLNKPVTYAVKGSPILNDATRTDALAAGLGTGGRNCRQRRQCTRHNYRALLRGVP